LKVINRVYSSLFRYLKLRRGLKVIYNFRNSMDWYLKLRRGLKDEVLHQWHQYLHSLKLRRGLKEFLRKTNKLYQVFS